DLPPDPRPCRSPVHTLASEHGSGSPRMAPPLLPRWMSGTLAAMSIASFTTQEEAVSHTIGASPRMTGTAARGDGTRVTRALLSGGVVAGPLFIVVAFAQVF